MSKKLSQIGEFGLINQIRKRWPETKSVLKSIGDDTAVVAHTKEKFLLLTADILVEGVHFKRVMSAVLIGRKALACSLSDIAAMGGVAKYALISLGVPGSLPVQFVKDLYQGIEKLARQFNVRIVGGDTVQSSKIVINVALTGEVKRKQLTTRAQAKPGDQIFVTGCLGNSFESGHHLKFVPRLKESQVIVSKLHPSSMIDISDGLAADLGHLMEESHVGARLRKDSVPLRKGADLNKALFEGEDFELLFTVPCKNLTVSARKVLKGLKCAAIGECTTQQGQLALIDANGKETKIDKKGFKHF